MLDSNRILLGILISSAIGAIAYRRGSLSRSGWLGAIITGTIIFGAGGWPHGITLVFFFVSSTLLSRWRTAYKATLERHVFEKGSQRDIWQALANAGPELPATRLGQVTAEPRLLLEQAGRTLLDLPLERLRLAYEEALPRRLCQAGPPPEH